MEFSINDSAGAGFGMLDQPPISQRYVQRRGLRQITGLLMIMKIEF